MAEIRFISTKTGKTIPVLVVNNVFVCFDREKILRVADLRPSDLESHAVGDSIKI